MKKIFKKMIKIFLGDYHIIRYRYALNIYRKKHPNITKIDKIKCFFINAFKIKVVGYENFSDINKMIKTEVLISEYFAYLIDFNCIIKHSKDLNNNMTPDYSVILNNSLEDIKKIYNKNPKEQLFINEVEKYLDNFIIKIEETQKDNTYDIIKNLKNIKNRKPKSLVEAMQRILFFNQIFWQMGYSLCGLGRLDLILDEYYKNDLKNKKEIKDNLEKIIIDFYTVLNFHFEYKSSCLYGDTGQIIIVGGINEKGENFENDLTYSFIKALKQYNKPDPKIFLRVNRNTTKDLIKIAIECMATGLGSPLLSNDDVIVPKLIEFGYDRNEVWNYVTAACWEPSPCGDSIDFNNAAILNLLEPFNNIFEKDVNYNSIKDIKKEYFINLSKYIREKLEELKLYSYSHQPYFSIFIKGCRENRIMSLNENIKNKNLGVTTLGIANVVNSILNIEDIVYDKKKLSLKELNDIRKQNFENEKVLEILKSNTKGYGSTNVIAIELTNEIMQFISNEFDKYETYYGGKFKFGLSAPSYVENGANTKASFDGRKSGEPFNVHISSNNNTYIDIMDFASNIKYAKNAINGNVVDYFLTPNYLINNIDKFTDYIIAYIKKGLYQLQINVIDSKTLIDARQNPELYRNLIVRVWGFSAYFNDLPKEYKELLIRRAQESERLYN